MASSFSGAPMKFQHLTLAFALVTAAGCTKMAVEGQVVDVTGTPIAAANITVMNSPCHGQTDTEGKFEINCPPGEYTFNVVQNGYITETVDVEAIEHKRYDIGRTVLIKIPESEGLFLLQEGEYVPMKPGLLKQNKGGSGASAYRNYCLAPETEINTLPAGVHALFDNESVGWRPWRVDPQDCAYKMVRDGRGWEVTYKDKPEFEERQAAPGKKISLIKLTPGKYFIADWKQGFFTKTPKDKKRYSGYYLEVQ